ncbi:type 2 lanthipeptide synthetase LanM family protein [Bacillus swezeyi]|uniref:type 2 lanthipeptide synthetase LanM family protein n=1 Tax=Bacillus swezeyi TaxID=1925020 RepID=UPI003F8A428A
MFDRNIRMIYKDNLQLAQESISNVLSIQSIEKVKNLYHTPLHKSTFTLSVYEKLKDDISEQTVRSQDIQDQIMFHPFALKVSGYFKTFLADSTFCAYRHLLADEAYFQKSVLEQLEKIILKISYRTLVLDLNVNREKRALAGKNAKEQYEYYSQTLLASPEYLKSFFLQYPGLLRLVGNEMRKYKKYINELLARFDKDQAMMASFFGFAADDLRIKEIQTGMGDSHSDGRKVTKIILKKGRLLYKPRSLRIDELYRQLAEFLNQKNGRKDIEIKTPKVLTRSRYGWSEYISFEQCANEDEIRTFYKRAGSQMALLYALKAVDFHSENLIAQGSHPVLIDLESLFHQSYERKVDREADAYMKAEKRLHESVRSLGLLPFFFGGKALDISGIGRKGKAKSLIKVPQIMNGQTAEMAVRRDYIEVDSAFNHPMLNDRYVYAKDYVEKLKEGFSSMYLSIKNHVQDLIEMIEDCENGIEVRFIPKPTVKYASLLELSFHPRFLHNSIDREAFLAKVWEESKQEDEYVPLVKHEFHDLIHNDIPYFKMKVNEKDLITSRHKRIEDYFSETAAESVKNRISQLSREDLNFQLKVIELSMLASEDNRQEVLKEFVTKDPAQYLSTISVEQDRSLIEKAEELAGYIENQAFQAKNSKGDTYSWLNATPVGVDEIQWNLSVMGDTFYDGLSGMAFTYLALWRATQKAEYLDIAENIMRDVISRFTEVYIRDDSSTYMSIGAYSGVSSIVYTLMNFYQFTKNDLYKERAKLVAKLIPELLQRDDELDIIGGAAGALAVLTQCFGAERDPLFLEVAELCAEHLLSRAIFPEEHHVTWEGIAGKPLTGFSHGNAGIIYALHLFSKLSHHKDINEFVKKGLAYENSKMAAGNWIDLRKPVKEAASSAWCHGSPGILLSRLALKDSNDPVVREAAIHDMDKACANIFYDGFGREQSLCHGDMGNGIILMDYGRKTGQPGMATIGRNLIAESAKAQQLGTYQCGVGRDVETPNLMLGLAGIVYGMLFAAGCSLPNILSLEIDGSEQKGAVS